MNRKIRVAFIKFGGLSAGGTERWLQVMAAHLNRELFEVDYYYCDAAPYVGATYVHTDTNKEREEYMKHHGVNLIKFNVGAKDVSKSTHDWINTDFWQIFDESKYDLVQTAKAGPTEYPYHLLKLPVIEYVTLSAGVDFSKNIACTIHLSNWQRKEWFRGGGDLSKSTVISIPVFNERASDNLRAKLDIAPRAVVAGFHQRDDDSIFSPVPLAAFKKVEDELRHFVIMGGGEKYRIQARELGLKNIHFVTHDADNLAISRFLNTLDIFAHGRNDGETFGTVLAEAMAHAKPCLSHRSPVANAQPETMGPGGFFVDTANEYSEKLELLFSQPALRQFVGQKGLAHARGHYTTQNCVERLQQVYKLVGAPEALSPDKMKTFSGDFASSRRATSLITDVDFSTWSYGLSPLGFLYPGVLEDKRDLAHHIFTDEVASETLTKTVVFLSRYSKQLVSFDDIGTTLSTFAFAHTIANKSVKPTSTAPLTLSNATLSAHSGPCSHPTISAYVTGRPARDLKAEVIRLNNWEELFENIDEKEIEEKDHFNLNQYPEIQGLAAAGLAVVGSPKIYLVQNINADDALKITAQYSKENFYIWSEKAHSDLTASGFLQTIGPDHSFWHLSHKERLTPWLNLAVRVTEASGRIKAQKRGFLIALPRDEVAPINVEFEKFAKDLNSKIFQRSLRQCARKVKRQIKCRMKSKIKLNLRLFGLPWGFKIK